ncbi:hypothetical protein J2X04_001698 [Lysobacter niabensis]|uniref:Uncharacterized protein n=1 Tax=Agrilutibacter niabensis TaxID=380628 RepID=A0ABU1VPD5_9GAMM|nr:hypothetical protein [Lysobacter niabensis]MDR7099351.1 hypothetical protein [Lysobacter niabensis]
MKRFWICAAVLICSTAYAQPMEATRPKEPVKIAPAAREQRPANRPTDAQHQVAVLSIKLDVVKGEVRSARVTSSKRIASYAPKVFARRAGDWEVSIEGETRKSFFVNNPALREAEAHPSSNDHYQWVGETGTIDWPLVVPLYYDGRTLGARSITIRDTRTGATILQTGL